MTDRTDPPPAPARDPGQRWMQLMRRGDFAAAWAVSDLLLRTRRPPGPDVPRHLQQLWDGRSLRGRRVLVHCYHGLGDTIQFIRFAPALRAIAAQVIVWAQADLIPLLSTAAGIDRLEPLHDGTPDFGQDADVEVMELPYILRTTVEHLPGTIPYLRAPGSRRPRPRKVRRIGLATSVGDWDKLREIPLPRFSPLAALPDVQLVAIRPTGRVPRPMHVARGTSTIAGTARLLRSLDLLIAADSMPAHLAGALGVPVWTLLRRDADWRWMEARDDSPWYPTMRLFRQPREGDWGEVIERVHNALVTNDMSVGALVAKGMSLGHLPTWPQTSNPAPRNAPASRRDRASLQ